MWQTNARAQHSLCPCSTFIWLLHSAPNYAHAVSLPLMELEGIFCVAYFFFGVSVTPSHYRTLRSETYRDEASSTIDKLHGDSLPHPVGMGKEFLHTNHMVDVLPVQWTPLSGSLNASTIMACKSTIVECGLRQSRPCYILCPAKTTVKTPSSAPAR